MISRQPAPRPAPDIGTHAKRILIVDDNSTVRRIVRNELEGQAGFACYEAANGLDAVKRARELKPDLVILDWAMPVMNGFEAAIALRREMPLVPLVLLTIYDDCIRASLANTVVVKAVVSKSEDMTALIDCVQNLLAQN